MTDELRAKFEATFPHLDFSADSYGNYYSQRTLDHWYGWQAAYASRDAEVEALRCEVESLRNAIPAPLEIPVVIDLTNESQMSHVIYATGWNSCRDAIAKKSNDYTKR